MFECGFAHDFGWRHALILEFKLRDGGDVCACVCLCKLCVHACMHAGSSIWPTALGLIEAGAAMGLLVTCMSLALCCVARSLHWFFRVLVW